MPQEQIVSRASLFEDLNPESSDELDYVYGAEPEFEFIEVEEPESIDSKDIIHTSKSEDEDVDRLRNQDDDDQIEEEGEQEQEMEMFKLFNTEDTQAISLRDDIEDDVVNERPDSYYFSTYSIEQRDHFILTAVTFQQVVQLGVLLAQPRSNYRVLDVNAYNAAIEREKLLKKRRSRPGKKKRMNRIACRERKAERKKIEAAKQAALKKKKFHKRGGKKNKKKDVAVTGSPSKPKYRTE